MAEDTTERSHQKQSKYNANSSYNKLLLIVYLRKVQKCQIAISLQFKLQKKSLVRKIKISAATVQCKDLIL